MTPTVIAYILYAIFALGGVGLFLCVPREHPRRLVLLAGAGLGGIALLGLLTLIAVKHYVPDGHYVLFCFFAAIAVGAAGRVITHPVPVYSAVYFGLVILSVAVLAVLQLAEFLAIALIIVYAGAVLVMYAFVIMLVRQQGTSVADVRTREPLLAIAASFMLMGAVAGQIGKLGELTTVAPPVVAESTAVHVPDAPAEPGHTDNTLNVGRRMFSKYVVAIELAGILLLVAMIGAIAIARKRVPTERSGPLPSPIGQVGRRVPPY